MIKVRDVLKSDKFCKFLKIKHMDNVEVTPLGQGEYNANYFFLHPETGEKLVLRINTGSQMNLENQISYEYDALKLLEKTGRTPNALFADDSKTSIPYGFLVMEYLPGRSLVYETDMEAAAQCLADIHNYEVLNTHHLISPKFPLKAIFEECEKMFGVYTDSGMGLRDVTNLIIDLLREGKRLTDTQSYGEKRCIINTELNSGNFLINSNNGIEGINGTECIRCKIKRDYVIDWEKPLFAHASQDLGHFLAPTTTFWKTDSILTQEDIDSFLKCYSMHSQRYRDFEFLKSCVSPYIAMTCLRGITWCSMAWVEYNSPDRKLKNEDTRKKINQYMDLKFLEFIRDEYVRGC